MARLVAIPQPVIAEVAKVATAAGCQLVAACDLAIASTEATFATPGVRIGLFCSTPMVALTRAIGRKRAMEMLLTGDPIDAPTALAWGLINRVVAPERLHDEALALARKIATSSPNIVAVGKSAFYRQIDLDQTEAYAYTKEVMTTNALEPDAHEGINAFLEKRPPRFPSRR
jgi:enoyl-CoA hydratase/carnithine racemase